MSADNWRQCPNCLKIARAKKSEMVKKVDEAYVHMPIAQFDQIRKECDEFDPDDIEKTLREDYEIGTYEEGVEAKFSVSYSCSCSECGFSFSHKDFQMVPLDNSKKRR